jgi:hypothetical protein
LEFAQQTIFQSFAALIPTTRRLKNEMQLPCVLRLSIYQSPRGKVSSQQHRVAQEASFVFAQVRVLDKQAVYFGSV